MAQNSAVDSIPVGERYLTVDRGVHSIAEMISVAGQTCSRQLHSQGGTPPSMGKEMVVHIGLEALPICRLDRMGRIPTSSSYKCRSKRNSFDSSNFLNSACLRTGCPSVWQQYASLFLGQLNSLRLSSSTTRRLLIVFIAFSGQLQCEQAVLSSSSALENF